MNVHEHDQRHWHLKLTAPTPPNSCYHDPSTFAWTYKALPRRRKRTERLLRATTIQSSSAVDRYNPGEPHNSDYHPPDKFRLCYYRSWVLSGIVDLRKVRLRGIEGFNVQQVVSRHKEFWLCRRNPLHRHFRGNTVPRDIAFPAHHPTYVLTLHRIFNTCPPLKPSGRQSAT